MKLFRDYTYRWWQVSVFKVAMTSVGVLLGAYFAPWVLAHVGWVALVAIVTVGYISFISLFH